MIKKFLDRIPSFLKNKYLLTGVAFLILMLFLDRNNLVYTFKNKRMLGKLTEEKGYYNNEKVEQTTSNN